MTISVFPLVAVAAAPWVNVRTLESPVAAKSKSLPWMSPVAPAAIVWVFESPVLVRVKELLLPCATVAAITFESPTWSTSTTMLVPVNDTLA